VDTCRALGLLGGYPGLLLCDAAQRLLRLGRCDAAESLAERAIATRAGGMVEGLAHGTRALLDVLRGESDAARERIALAREHLGPDAAISWTGPIDAAAAELELWDGRPEEARAVVGNALAARSGEDDSFFLGRLLWVGVRAEADLAERARAPADVRDLRDDATRADTLARRIAALVPAPEVELYDLLSRAERTRLAHAPETAAWAPAIGQADDLGLVATGAYGRWRQSEAALFLGRRHDASEPLRAAASVAARLGAQPLLAEIRALARRGRVELGNDEPAADDLDLTARERDVLRLVAAGRTNREIGVELYMSPKTASVHVSRILHKLDVRGRIDAATVAHRLGLD
jgi:DNA-binding CsgD family transcriptional regulator